ncbi:MAG: aminotransferase class I/II-fold pyridoxal phosphate-dependent enzyme, partial [Pseudomonadota bacterium]
DQTHMQSLVSRIADLRGTLQKALSQAGYKCPESHTNFVLIPFADLAAARRADRRLREAQIVLRNMSGYGLPKCLRATIGTPDAMARLASALAAGPKA